MQSSSVTRLMDAVRAQAPGAMEGSIRSALFMTLKEFTQRSNVWREVVCLTVPANCKRVDFSIDANAYVNRLIYSEADGGPSPAILAGVGFRGAILEPLRTASKDVVWALTVGLTISDPTDADGLPYFPDELFEKYQLGLISGVICQLMLQPAKPYSNTKMAAYHAAEFRRAIHQAKAEVEHGFTHRGQRWAFPQGFKTHSQRKAR